MYTYFLLPCIRKELPVVSPVDTKYVRYIATCRNYYVYANTLISLWCNPLFQLLMPYRMCKCNSLCCKDRIIKVKDKRYKTYNRKEWEHIISETFHADQDSCKQSISSTAEHGSESKSCTEHRIKSEYRSKYIS